MREKESLWWESEGLPRNEGCYRQTDDMRTLAKVAEDSYVLLHVL